MAKKETSTGTIILILLVLYVIACLAGGAWVPWEWSFVQKAPSKPTGEVSGLFNIGVTPYQTLDIGAQPLTVGTNYNCFIYANRGGWILLGSITTSTNPVTIEVTPSDGGYIYMVVEVISGQNYYVDYATTKTKNPRVASFSYEDPDHDGYKEWVFKFNMANIPASAGANYPTVYFYPYFYAYEKPSINSPSDITGIGTAKVTKYIEWYLTFSTQKKAFAISKIEITINTTDTSKVELKNVNVPGIGYLSGDAFGEPQRGVNTLTWTYTISQNLNGADYVTYGLNQLNKFDCTNTIECQLGSNDVLEFTITITGRTPTDSATTITDTVLLKAGS